MSTRGYVYLLINPSMEGLVKIGKTTRDPAGRARELSAATGIPTPFVLAYDAFFADCSAAEEFVHALLEQKGYRVSSNREFFTAPLNEAIKAVSEAERVFGHLIANSQSTITEDDPADAKLPWEEVLGLADASYYGHDLTIQDYAEAFRLYTLAAKLGSSQAFIQLGIMSRYGFGRKKDSAAAVEFFKQGLRLGDDRCWAEMASLFSWDALLLPGDRTRNIENATKCWTHYFGSEAFRDVAPHPARRWLYFYNRSQYMLEYINEVQCGLLPLMFKKELSWLCDTVIASTTEEAEKCKHLAELRPEEELYEDQWYRELAELSPQDEWYRKQVESRSREILTYQRLKELVDSAIFVRPETPRDTVMIDAYTKLSKIKASSGLRGVVDYLSDGPPPEPTFSQGEDVRLLAGPFAGFTGTVENIDVENRVLKVGVSIFGRLNTIESNFCDVKKCTSS